MNKLKIIFLAIISGSVFLSNSFAQKEVNDATISYKISIVSLNDKNAISKPLDGATLNLYITKSESRSDMVNTLGKESNLFDAKTGNGVILKEYSGQKLMIKLTRENWMQKNQYFRNMKFNIDNTEIRIGGYACKKATAKTDEGKEFVVYFMSDVKLANKDYNNSFAQLPGIPVQYEWESGKLKFTYTLSGISYENIPANKFDIPKSGFRVMTYDESQQLKKG